MMMKPFLSLFFTLFLSATPALAEVVTQPSVSVTGYAESKVAPDQAMVNVEVYSENKDLQAAKKEQDAKVKKLVELAKKQGIATDDIRTQYANVQPLYDYVENNKPRFRAYSLSNQIALVVKKIETTGPTVDALVSAGFDRIQGIQFGLQEERTHRDALMKQALLNAKSKAADMVAVYGGTLGKPLSISESGAVIPPPMPMMAKREMAMAADAGGSMPSYSPTGMIEIQQTVNVTFAME